MMENNGLSVADIAAVTRNNNNDGLFGGDGSWLAILFLFSIFGWGGAGFGGMGGGGILPWLLLGNNGFGGYNSNCATQADLSAAFASNATLNGINGIDSALCQGFNGINTAILQNGYNTQGAINGLSHQLSDCCCATQRAIDGAKYENATNTCAIQNTIQNTTRDVIENANANSRAILDFLVQDKLASKDARIAQLENKLSQSEQNAFISATIDASQATLIRRLGRDCPVPAYVVPNPNCCYNYSTQPACNGII